MCNWDICPAANTLTWTHSEVRQELVFSCLVPHKAPISKLNQLIRVLIYVWPTKEFLMAHNIFASPKNNSVGTRWLKIHAFCWLNLPDFCSSQSRLVPLCLIILFFYHFSTWQHELQSRSQIDNVILLVNLLLQILFWKKNNQILFLIICFRFGNLVKKFQPSDKNNRRIWISNI